MSAKRRRFVSGSLVLVLALCSFASSAGAGAWTQPKSRLWVKAAFIYQFTKTIYAADEATLPDGTMVQPGDERPYDDEGAYRQRTLWFEGEYGITDRFTLGAQFPYHDLRFEDAFQVTESWGFGDIRFVGRAAILTGQQRRSLRGAWELAVGKASTDPDDVPVSEGQPDFDLGLQWGMSLGRQLSWLGVEGGYRWRLEDEEGRVPGNEWFWRAEAGYAPVKAWNLGIKLAYEGLRAGTTYRDELPEPGQRSFDRLEFGLLWRLGPWILEPLVASTLAGERFPAGETWTIGLHRVLDL